MSNKNNFGRGFSGKGYYIALILCAAAIGISGYLYYRNMNQNDIQLQDPTSGVDVLSPTNGDVQALATDPTIPNASVPGATNPTPGSLREPLKTGMPVSGEMVMEYAMDVLCYNPTTRDWRTHNGVDIAAEAGTKVCAAADGVVYTTYEDESLGMTVVIRHQDGYVTTYSSLAKELAVTPGDSVVLGQAIGTVDNSALLESAVGDHVHFSVTCNDAPVDPVVFFSLS